MVSASVAGGDVVVSRNVTLKSPRGWTFVSNSVLQAFGYNPAMRAIAWVSVAVGALWVPMALTYPFGWDQGLFAWAGAVILRGGTPYADAWDMKGPLAYYVYALTQAIFGVNLWGIRVVDLGFLLCGTFAVFEVAGALTSAVTARWTALIFFLWYASHSYWHTAQPEGWTAMLLITALAPLLAGTTTSGLRLAAVGFSIGLATLFKPLWAAFLLLPMLYVLAVPTRRGVRSLYVLAGWLLPLAVTLAWFAYRGALAELIAVHVRYSALYAALTPANRLRGLVEYVLAGRVVAVLLPAALYGAVLLWRARRLTAGLLVAWLGLVVLAVTVQGRFFAYHWLPLLPAATLLGAVALHELSLRVPTLAYLTTAVILMHCLAPIALEEARFVYWMAGARTRDAYYDGYGEPGNDLRAIRWLRERGRPGDVYLFGWQGAIPWLSERRVVSRFGFSMPLMIGEGLDVREKYRAELLDALRATPPEYILVAPQAEQIIGAKMTLEDFPDLANLVRTRYREVARFGTITIHELTP